MEARAVMRFVVLAMACYLVLRVPDPSTYTLAACALVIIITEPRGESR